MIGVHTDKVIHSGGYAVMSSEDEEGPSNVFILDTCRRLLL